MILLILLLTLVPVVAHADGNATIASYADAKRMLYGTIYADHRLTLYCQAQFDAQRQITLPPGFVIAAHQDRALRAETEHIVAAENFGRAFQEWREGAPQCVDSHGRAFKGRKCAETNEEFRLMEADLHNLAPAIGAVNATRRNYRFGPLLSSDFDWGSCPIKIHGRVVEPPDYAKGLVARSHLYMANAYPARYRLSRAQRKLFEAWDKQFPPDAWECERERRIARLQKNRNELTARKCHS
ncbi:MAG: endonuclease [Desulfovibrio sp.]|nr:endonuclease [Desulfovibrio sp.]